MFRPAAVHPSPEASLEIEQSSYKLPSFLPCSHHTNAMPALRTAAESTLKATKQLTLTGKPAPAASTSKSKSSRSKSNKVERVYTDAILAIKPEFTELIAAREKNHEYRAYKLRETVVRIWLYNIAPTAAITHIMETALPKTPGQVCDPTGVGNDDFDNGLKKSKFGYPVLGLYRLKNPLQPDEMKKYGVSPPQGLVYVPKKMVDEYPLEDMEKLF
ncbi:hypothetical protein Hypma_007256 [Hypsizygus marmoreus]|uniref:Uncharacterized protein n=1 Tax=Hypsizygus marmoreus TaxID=39966 RepID=A0A369K7B7_HYPMA|nr:hypothetical protein Hypma_007256 [Hypsizygus marmoreus]